MAKTKVPTLQERHAAQKQREQEEKEALMPPGLINHGNTCFMNSVLQGLIATRLLADLVYFRPIPPTVQAHSHSLLAARRSPLLTNGSTLAGEYEEKWSDAMPIGDVFVNVMLKAWVIQNNRRKESQSPRSLLLAVGRKYDQYLDFAQQDAHEFMRILVDAMRMEEFDVIKTRQPPPPPTKKRRRKQPSETADETEKLMTLSDMIFGGQLTSILVCQKCKHVSQTYEDFNDLSLSIKPEDYSKERKRDRLKHLAKRFVVLPAAFPSTTLSVDNYPPRSSSAPPGTPRELPQNAELQEYPMMDDPRRRSYDLLPKPPVNESAISSSETVALLGSEEPSIPLEKHLEFGDMPKPDREKKNEDAWAKLGRRLSIGLYKERKSRSRERQSMSASPDVLPTPPRPETPSIHIDSPSPKMALAPSITTSTATSPGSSRAASKTRVTHTNRSRSPKPPKPSKAETEYLRRILADVTITSSSANPFTRLNHQASSQQSMWFKMAQLPGIEDCLKMFTAVEILDGDNCVRCRRCWKIANGLYQPKVVDDDSDSQPITPPVRERVASGHSAASLDIPTSLSTPDLPSYSHDAAMSMVSLPTTIAAPGGLPIPSISTTRPPTPEDEPQTARPRSLDDSEDSHDTQSDTRLAAPANCRHMYDDDDSSSEEEDDTDGEKSQSGHSGKKPKPFIMRPAYKRYLIAAPPPVLVVHLKRFQQLSKTPMLSFSSGFKKLDDYVSFPEMLDLTPFLAPKKEDLHKHAGKERCMYQLYAVVVHIGNMLGGHYVAYTALPPSENDKGKEKRQWAYISDTVVRLTTLDEVLKTKAYICMYERV